MNFNLVKPNLKMKVIATDQILNEKAEKSSIGIITTKSRSTDRPPNTNNWNYQVDLK